MLNLHSPELCKCHLYTANRGQIKKQYIFLRISGVSGIADASEKLALDFHATTMGPRLVTSKAGLFYEMELSDQKQQNKKKVSHFIRLTICQ